jgi:hypothetical protein
MVKRYGVSFYEIGLLSKKKTALTDEVRAVFIAYLNDFNNNHTLLNCLRHSQTIQSSNHTDMH